MFQRALRGTSATFASYARSVTDVQDEPSRVHAQLAAEQNCEEGMGWPDRMPEDLEVLAAAPGDEDDEDTE